MNIQEVCVKYKISEAFLNSKDDGYTIAINSIKDIVREIDATNGDEYVSNKLKRLGDFLYDVKNSSY